MSQSRSDTEDLESKRKRYADAVREFNRNVPYFTRFARAITGKPNLIVRAAVQTQTDGQIIEIAPPIELANKINHDRAVCDRRYSDGKLICSACERAEAMNVRILHEMGHIIFESLEPKLDVRFGEKARKAAEQWGTEFYIDLIKASTQPSYYKPFSPQDALDSMPEYVRNFWLSVEDVRMENLVFAQRPGYEVMVWHAVEVILNEGIYTQESDEPSLWSDKHEDIQLLMAVLCQCQDHVIGDRLDERVVAAVESDSFAQIMAMPHKTTLDSVVISVALVGLFNRMGFLLLDDEPESPPTASEPGEGDSEGDDGDGEPDPGETDQEDSRADENDADGNESDTTDDTGRGDGEEKAEGENNGDSGEKDDESEPGKSSDENADESDAGTDSDVSEDEADSAESSADDNDGDGSPRNSGSEHPDQRSDDTESSQSDSNSGGSNSDVGETDPTGDSSDDGSQDSAENKPDPTPGENREQATVEEWEHVLGYLCQPHAGPEMPEGDKGLLEIAVNQAEAFDEYSELTNSLTEYDSIDDFIGDFKKVFSDSGLSIITKKMDKNWTVASPGREVIAGSLMRARRIFSDSKMDRHVRNLRKGRLSTKSLGRRAWGDDDRLFRQRIKAEGISDEVIIAMDISGSTASNKSSQKIKEISHSTADILHAVGVPFSIFAHTTVGWDQAIITIKSLENRYDDTAKRNLLRLPPSGGSLDGHNMEFYRKKLQRSTATRKLLIYFTDGHIPDTNREEQVPLVRREVENFAKLGVHLLVIGVHTDAPSKIGLDTVLVNSSSDMTAVIKEIERRLLAR